MLPLPKGYSDDLELTVQAIIILFHWGELAREEGTGTQGPESYLGPESYVGSEE